MQLGAEGVASRAVAALPVGSLDRGAGFHGGLLGCCATGDQDQAAVAERPWYREVVDEPDPDRQLRRNAHNARMVKQRIGGVLKILRSAAPVDPDAEALWRLVQTDFHDNQRVIVESLQAKQALQPGLEVTRAADILWTLNHPDVWLLLVGERGWTPEQWELWFADTACAQLLRRPPTNDAEAEAADGA
jgi:hypothetical protein